MAECPKGGRHESGPPKATQDKGRTRIVVRCSKCGVVLEDYYEN